MADYIVHTTAEGKLAVTLPCNPNKTLEQIASRVVPTSTQWYVVASEDFPTGFRNAWEYNNGVVVNMDKAKDIAHGVRRQCRDEEFKPYDDIIAKQIPGEDADDAEAQRALIRTKYATKQTEIDACTTPEALQTIIDDMRGGV